MAPAAPVRTIRYDRLNRGTRNAADWSTTFERQVAEVPGWDAWLTYPSISAVAPVPEWAAAMLTIEPGTAVPERRRQRWVAPLVNGERDEVYAHVVEAYDSYYLPALAEVPGLLTDGKAGVGGGLSRIEDAGYEITAFEEVVTTRHPSEDEGITFGLGLEDWLTEVLRSIIAGAVVLGAERELAYLGTTRRVYRFTHAS